MGPTRIVVRVAVAMALMAAATGCLRADVLTLSADGFGGRRPGTAGAAATVDYVAERLESFASGGNPAGEGREAYLQHFSNGTNVVGLIPGTTMPDEYVIVGAHWDHLGSSCSFSGPADDICNGATDNATGVAGVLEVGQRLAKNPPARSVLLVLWDGEEFGYLGSKHYTANPLVPLADTVAYVNLDLLGANLLPSLRNTSFAVAAETGGPVLEGIVADAVGASPLDVAQFSAVFGLYRSDYASFLDAQVPSVYFTDSTGPCYHTVYDEYEIVDFAKLREQVTVVEKVTRELASVAVTPTFTSGLPVATYDDTAQLLEIVHRAESDRDRYPPHLQEILDEVIVAFEQVVADGPEEFGNDDVVTLLTYTVDLIDLLTYGPCDGFLPPE